MNNTLPEPVAAYITAANAHDPEAVAACFSEDGVVEDEKREYVGRAAIRDWIAAADRMYAPQIEPQQVTQDGVAVVLHGKVSGTFPGSPVVLRFFFTLAEARIAGLRIEE